MKLPEKTYKPTDLQLDIYSYFKEYKEFFYCFLDDESVVYKLDENYIKIGKKELKQKLNVNI